MKLAEVAVTNYRSIQSTEKFTVDDFTVLVGPNNEGKSNLLRALQLGFNLIRGWSNLDHEDSRTSVSHSELTSLARMTNGSPTSRIAPRLRPSADPLRFVFDRDFPRNHKHYDDHSGTTTIRLTFRLSDEEIAHFKNLIGSSNNGTLPIRLDLNYRSAKLQISKPGRGNRVLAAKTVSIMRNIVDSFGFFYIPALRTSNDVTGLVQNLVTGQLVQMQLNDEYIELRDKMSALRDKAIAAVDSSLTASLKEYVPNLQGVRVETTDPDEVFRVLNVHLDDGVETELDQKGDGIKSLAAISMMQESSRIAASSETFVLAIEEPEAHLHPEAIHDMKTRLLNLARDRQVIISTHNPVLVNRENVSSNIIVERNEARPARSLPELRDILGVRLSDNMSAATLLVLVEGVTDERVLHAYFKSHSARLRKAIADGELMLISYAGTGKLQTKLASLRTAVTPWFVITDDDDSGRAGIKKALEQQTITESDYAVLVTPGMKHSELENMYEPAVTQRVVRDVTQRELSVGEATLRRGRWSDGIASVLAKKGLIVDQALVERLKIEASHIVAADVESGLKPEWSSVLDAVTAQLEQRFGAKAAISVTTSATTT